MGDNGGDASGPLVGRGRAEPGAADAADDADDAAPVGAERVGEPARSVPRPLLRPPRDRPWSHAAIPAPNVRMVLGVTLAVALAAAWLTFGQSRSSAAPSPARPSPRARTTLASRAPATRQPAVAMPRWVPSGLAATCRAQRAAKAVVVDCTPGRGVVALQYRGFRSLAALRAAYATAAQAGGSGPPACAAGAPEERSWSEAGSPARVRGRYRCSLVGGHARIEWTRDDSRVLAVATRADGDLRSLYLWWVTAPGPAAPPRSVALPDDR